MDVLVVTKRGLISEEWLKIIEKRDSLIVKADHFVNIAMDKGVDVTPFRQYRQALRDIPQTYSDPDNVIWPDKPVLPE